MEGGEGIWENDNSVRRGFLVSLNCLIITEQLDIKTKQKNIDNIQNKITLQVTPKNL